MMASLSGVRILSISIIGAFSDSNQRQVIIMEKQSCSKSRQRVREVIGLPAEPEA